MSKVLTMCPGCSSKIRVPDKYLGQKISCPKCQGIVLVQDIEADEPESDDQPRPVTKPAVTAPAKPAARLAPPPIAKSVAPLAKKASPPPARPRKPAPVEVIDDFEEVPDDDLFEEIDGMTAHPRSSGDSLPRLRRSPNQRHSIPGAARAANPLPAA